MVATTTSEAVLKLNKIDHVADHVTIFRTN